MRPARLVPYALLIATLAATLGGCAAEARRRPPSTASSPHWLVLGDRGAGPDLTALLPLPEGATPGGARVLDLSSDGASIDAIVNHQMLRLGGTRAERFILCLGPADATGPAPPQPDAYGALVGALLATLGGRGGGIVSTIPATTSAPDTVGDVRRILEFNEQIRAAARAHGAILVEREHLRRTAADAATVDRRAWRAALAVDLPPDGGEPASETPDWLVGLDGGARRALQERVAAAVASGARPNVVAKIGDSITATPAFLAQVTAADVEHGSHAALAGTLDYFSHTPVPPGGAIQPSEGAGTGPSPAPDEEAGQPLVFSGSGGGSSWSRASLAAGDGWTVAEVLAGGEESPLARELAALRPAVALVMFGTNDLTRDDVEAFETSLDDLLRSIEAARVLPVLSTIPARTDDPEFARRVPRFNAAVRALAALHRLPLIDYGAATAHLPDLGLSTDGIHPSTCPEGAGSFSEACLRYGSNLRNLLTLQALDLLRRFVLEPPEGHAVALHSDG
jgi:hypothetical protein